MLDPRVDDGLRNVVVNERLDQNLSPTRKLPSKDPMRSVRLIERSPLVEYRSAEVFRCVLVLEPLDAISLCALKQEADHGVVEASVDEIVDDNS